MDVRATLERLGEPFSVINRDSRAQLLLGIAATLIGWYVWAPVGWTAAAVTAGYALVSRDPERVTPLRDGLVVAPADGVVADIEHVRPPAELGLDGDERVRVSIHVAILEVPVHRAPVSGRVTAAAYVPGTFHSARESKSSDENERRTLVIETAGGEDVVVAQIAGTLARRLVTFPGEGDTVAIGQRIGLVQFGSRVDLYLPPGRAALVAVGQRMVAGETVVADVKSDEGEREARRS